MNKLFVLFCAAILTVFLISSTHAVSAGERAPGVMASINTNSLTKLTQQLVPDMLSTIRSATFPGVSGKKFGVKWGLQNIRVSQINIKTIKVEAGNGIWVDFSNLDVKLQADATYKILFFKRAHCPASAEVKGGSIRFRVYLHAGNDSYLKADVSQFNIRMPNAKIKLHGSFIAKILQFIINVFTKIVKTALDLMRREIDKGAKRAFNSVIDKTLLRIPIEKWATLDFGLVRSVSYQNNNIIAAFDGNTIYQKKGSDNPLFIRPKIDLAPHNNLIQLKLSSFFFNTFFHAFYTHKAPTRYKEITPSNPQGFPYPLVLDPSSPKADQWNKISPKILQNYNNKNVIIKTTLLNAPTISLAPNDMTINITPLVSFYTDNATSENNLMFSVIAKTSISATATIAQQSNGQSVLLLQLNQLSVKFHQHSSKIGDITFDTLNDLTAFFTNIFIVPTINHLLADGIPLPSASVIRFVNTQFQVETDALYLSTDIQYVRSSSGRGGGDNVPIPPKPNPRPIPPIRPDDDSGRKPRPEEEAVMFAFDQQEMLEYDTLQQDWYDDGDYTIYGDYESYLERRRIQEFVNKS